MKKLIKKNIKLFIGIIVGLLITGTTVYAATINQVGFDNTNAGLTKNNQPVDNVQDALDAIYTKVQTEIPPCNLKLGDYFSLTPDVTSFTVTKASTGYSSDQTIKIAGTSANDGLRLWRVIDIHKDGSFDAVSEYVSDDAVYFTGATGYQYFVSTLQMIAGQYAKSGYTISTRMMGYNGQTPVIQTYSDATACANDATCKKTTTYAFDESTNDAPQSYSSSDLTRGTGQEYLKGVGGDNLYLKDYLLVSNVYGNVIASKVGTTTNTDYWIASRAFYFRSASNFYLTGRCIHSYGFLNNDALRSFNSGWYDDTSGYSVRPILTLKSGITTSGGTGEKTNPYILS